MVLRVVNITFLLTIRINTQSRANKGTRIFKVIGFVKNALIVRQILSTSSLRKSTNRSREFVCVIRVLS